MAVRADVNIDWTLSPRLILVDAPSKGLILQDLHDTLVDRRQNENGMDETFTPVNSSGKENLGGGVKVGITSLLQNCHVGFQARTASVSQGTVTTATIPIVPGILLIDSAADFITDGVKPGASVINFTDTSIATVLRVDSPTQLLCQVLEDGTDNQFDFNDSYKIWNVEQVTISGGNLVAVDNLDAEISAVFPTAFTQVILALSSSTTLLNVEALEIIRKFVDNDSEIDPGTAILTIFDDDKITPFKRFQLSDENSVANFIRVLKKIGL